ncbi:MAG: HD domain-containing protein [Candidatus Micrarchaeota archaeon]
MYIIKDSVHGNIKLTELERSLIDTKEMQRLRGIKQLALTNLVYLGANHTRFEHSLGAAHLTGEICESLGIGEKSSTELRAAALLHDIGHGAFSHESEYFLKKHLGETHESIARKKLESERISAHLEREGMKPKRIASLLCGEGPGVVITSGVGSDRMDYLQRDSYYTGVAYGVIDSQRLIHTMSLSNGSILLQEGGLEAAESLMLARFLMFSTVYSHHAVRIASAMLRRAIELGIGSMVLKPVDLLCLDDWGVMSVLLGNERAGRFVRNIENRELYKRALVCDFSSLPMATQALLKRNLGRELAKEIAEKAKLSEDDVLVDVPVSQYKEAKDVEVLMNGKQKKLSLASELVGAIRAAEEKRQRLIIACPQAFRKRVERAAKQCLEL